MVGEQEGALEDILAALCGEQHIILQHIMPYESGFVPFAGPGIHGSHALPSQRVQPADHIPEVECFVWGGEAHLHQVWVLQVPSTAAQVVHHRHGHTTLAWAATTPPRCPSL